ncbi:MAG: DNRLRE domain-containing protein, partial [Anaerostipes sp.]|nr:DNRLRE domain-containing protein [Anaerostipes sp.]
MKKIFNQSISIVMSVLLVITSITWTGITINLHKTQAEEKVTKEVIDSESTKTSTTFELSNGKKQTTFFSQDVRYKDKNGKLKDYDPSLVKIQDKKSTRNHDLSKYQYVNKSGDKKQYLPKKLSQDTPVLMENGDYEISFAPITGQEEDKDAPASDEESQLNLFSQVTDIKTKEVETEKVLTAEDKKEELPVTATYEAKDYTFGYQSLDTGVKETITLNEKPESNVMQFSFTAKNMVVKKNATTEGITFYDKETEDIVAAMEAPSMNDAGEEAYSEALTYDVKKVDGEEDTYILTLTMDEDYLNDKNRQYPITIDPTVTWKGSSRQWDAYVINGSYKNSNFYDSGITVMMAGDAKQGLYRTYLRFLDFTKTVKGKYVESATLSMYETGNSQSGQTIEARQVKADWKRGSLTWSNRPGYGTNYGSVKTTGTTHKKRDINVLNYARTCANGSASVYGLMLKNADETKSYGQFYSSRYSNASYRPKLSVVYYDAPLAPTKMTSTPYYVKAGKTTTIGWEGISAQALDRVQYRVAHFDYATNKETGAVKGYTTVPSNSKSKTGSMVFSTSGLTDGAYKIAIRGVSPGDIYGKEAGKGIIVDGTNPVISSVSLGEGKTEDTPSSNSNPTLTWKVTEKNPSKVQYKVGSGSYVNAGTTNDGSVKIAESNFKDTGAYKITVKVQDQAGNSAEKEVTYYYIDQAKAADFTPTEVKSSKSYGKAVISWTPKEGVIPGSIYYEVHRGTTADFTPSGDTLVQSAVKNNYCADTRAGDGKTYYYKVRAVKLAKTGKVLETGTSVTTDTIKQDTKGEYQQFLGSKDYRDTVEVSTPNGTGTIDKASGNLLYGADDFDISLGASNVSLTRTYNSQSDKKGMLGNGWYDSFHKELYQVGDSIVFEDSDGTYVTFQKDGDTYTSKETKDYTLKLEKGDGKLGDEAVESPNDVSDSVLVSTGEIETDYTASHNVTPKDTETTETTKNSKIIAVSCTLTDKSNNIYKFDANGNLTAMEDANGNFMTYEYDNQGRLSKVTTKKDQTLTMEYEGNERQVSKIVLPDETSMKYQYENGNLTSASHVSKDESQAVTYQYTYDKDNWLTKIADAKGQAYHISYENQKAVSVTKPQGDAQKITYGEGTTKVASYGTNGTKRSEDSIQYEASTGKLLSAKNVNGIETTYQYEDSSNALLNTGTQTTVDYQNLEDNQMVSFHTDIKVSTSTTYNADENVTKEVDETGQTTTTTYDEAKTGDENLPASETTTNAEDEKVSDIDYKYDEDGNVLSETDDIEETKTEYAYDEDGEVIKKTQMEEGVVTSVENTQLSETDYKITEESNVTQGQVEEASETVYDAMGRAVTTTDKGTGEVTKTTYDFMGRDVAVEIAISGEDSKTTKKTYDANGAVEKETTATGVTTSYTYDSNNRVIKAVEEADGKSKTTKTSYGYDNASIHTLSGTKEYENLSVVTTTVNGNITEKTYTDEAGNNVRTLSSGIYTDHVFTGDGKEIATITLGNSTSGNEKVTMNLFNQEGKQTHTIQ